MYSMQSFLHNGQTRPCSINTPLVVQSYILILLLLLLIILCILKVLSLKDFTIIYRAFLPLLVFVYIVFVYIVCIQCTLHTYFGTVAVPHLSLHA